MNQPVADERLSNTDEQPARVRFSCREFDGGPVRSGAVGFRPGFSAHEQRIRIGQALGRHYSLESRQPMLVVARAIVRLTAHRGSAQFLCETGRPLFPREVALL